MTSSAGFAKSTASRGIYPQKTPNGFPVKGGFHNTQNFWLSQYNKASILSTIQKETSKPKETQLIPMGMSPKSRVFTILSRAIRRSNQNKSIKSNQNGAVQHAAAYHQREIVLKSQGANEWEGVGHEKPRKRPRTREFQRLLLQGGSTTRRRAIQHDWGDQKPGNSFLAKREKELHSRGQWKGQKAGNEWKSNDFLHRRLPETKNDNGNHLEFLEGKPI